ncbi:MAG: thiamine pyrophosphate-binding protein [Clostridiales bacterium]|jgi:acetolactate synthase-1/2/3 large subunit|nr:thiamine pyrophosphate-binding protein [Clostridiales bacterium]
MVRCSDYIWGYLKSLGVTEVFTLTGGGIMYLVESLGNSGIPYICCHHEQACSIAAQASAMYSGKLGVCLVTTGPGGTNALTGAAAAYMDSTPVLFISGQVKRDDFASKRGVRQFGAQENDIISMVKPVTKYAEMITEPEDTLFHLQKAIYLATGGRKGPVWLDIPLDVQSAFVDETRLKPFSPVEDEAYEDIPQRVSEVINLLKESKRPLILAGHGVYAAFAQERLKQLVYALNVPVMATWRALGIFGSDEALFMGSPGLQAPRYSNLILQSCDLLLILGSRLDNMITAFNEEHFAFNARKIMVDIDAAEIKKLHMPHVNAVVADVGAFLTELLRQAENEVYPDFKKWITACVSVKQKFPLALEKQSVPEGVDLYRVAEEISRLSKPDDVIVVSSTSRCNTAGHIAFGHKRGQRFISSMAMGSMGFALPSAAGAYYASGGGRVIVLEGDGSFQLNIQELQTLKTHNIPAKIFIFNNSGYAAITQMQERNFNGHYVGSNPQSGVDMPDLEKIADAYGIPYFRIGKNEDINDIVKEIMDLDSIAICDIIGSLRFDEIPKCISSLNKEGKRVSAALENPFPFLPDSELRDTLSAL